MIYRWYMKTDDSIYLYTLQSLLDRFIHASYLLKQIAKEKDWKDDPTLSIWNQLYFAIIPLGIEPSSFIE